MRSPKRGNPAIKLPAGTLPGVFVAGLDQNASTITYERLAEILADLLDIESGYYMSPLCAPGDATTGELIFAPDGDVVMVPVPF